MNDRLRILRYNTGTDKKAFVKFKKDFDAVIFNSTIVAYSGASVADLVSMHKRKYIIDPQTYIFQQEITAITKDNKRDGSIKNSVLKYLLKLPEELSNIIIQQRRPLTFNEIDACIELLVNDVFSFQTGFIDDHIAKKDYNKYLDFIQIKPEPFLIIAPYFMLKDTYSQDEIDSWLELNRKSLKKTIEVKKEKEISYPIAAQLVLEKRLLISNNIIESIKSTYNFGDYEYIFIWIDDFNCFDSDYNYKTAFSSLISALNDIGKKPIMAYGGYESIILCSNDSPYKLYGVAQSVGYGEYRPIIPVGGGLPVNKYYFLPLHRRMKFNEASAILASQGYFSNSKSKKEHAQDYFNYICNCEQCHEVIKQDINNFVKFNEAIPFEITTKSGVISRNRPTPEAELISSFHFLYCKVHEWNEVFKRTFDELINELIDNYKLYLPEKAQQIVEWCDVYGKK